MFEIVAARPHYFDALAIALTTDSGHGDAALSVKILRRYGVGLQHILWRTLKHHLASFAPSLRAYVHNPVGSPHHVLVVFHHYNRVAEVAQFLERAYELLIVALMKANARLIEDVKHVDKLRANLRGKPNALALTTGERSRLTIEREIIETHFQKEVDPCL